MPFDSQQYLTLKADQRLEFRVPSLLKDHLAQVAQAQGKTVSEYALGVLAERVSADIGAAGTWGVSPAEFLQLLKVLAAPAPETPAMAAARKRSAALFGARHGR